MTFMGRHNLAEIWPQLDDSQKRGITTQLDIIISRLRSLPCPDGTPFGKIGSGRCIDARRGIRTSQNPITSSEQFEDFISSGS
jgi:hypothetical protein